MARAGLNETLCDALDALDRPDRCRRRMWSESSLKGWYHAERLPEFH